VNESTPLIAVAIFQHSLPLSCVLLIAEACDPAPITMSRIRGAIAVRIHRRGRFIMRLDIAGGPREKMLDVKMGRGSNSRNAKAIENGFISMDFQV
jgi:hypothetical protein